MIPGEYIIKNPNTAINMELTKTFAKMNAEAYDRTMQAYCRTFRYTHKFVKSEAATGVLLICPN